MSTERGDTDGAIDLDEAARRLGVARASVRMAINRGFLKGYQTEDGRWKVYLDRHGDIPRPPPGGKSNPAERAAETLPAETNRMTSSVESLLAEQVEYLRKQLDRRDATVAAKDSLIAELTARLAKLGRSAVDRIGSTPVSEKTAPPDQTTPTDAELQKRTLHNIAETLLMVRNYLEQQRARRSNIR